jgi:hypothetical protein
LKKRNLAKISRANNGNFGQKTVKKGGASMNVYKFLLLCSSANILLFSFIRLASEKQKILYRTNKFMNNNDDKTIENSLRTFRRAFHR